MTLARIERIEIGGRAGLLVPLRDGTTAFIAPVTPDDRQRLRRAVKELSPTSRYLRFFSPASELTEEQIKRFTEVDQIDHVAWGAMDISQPEMPGLGLGRMVREEADPSVAEFAIAVVDRAQHKGLGSTLTAMLMIEARSRGIRTFRALVLPQNTLVLEWFEKLGASLRREPDACEVLLSVPRRTEDLPDASSTARRFAARLHELQLVVR